MHFIKELWLFIKERRKIWLAPLIIVLLMVGFLLVFSSGSAVAPFIYSLF